MLEIEKMGEWCDNLLISVPDCMIWSILLVRMLSMQVFLQCGQWRKMVLWGPPARPYGASLSRPIQVLPDPITRKPYYRKMGCHLRPKWLSGSVLECYLPLLYTVGREKFWKIGHKHPKEWLSESILECYLPFLYTAGGGFFLNRS